MGEQNNTNTYQLNQIVNFPTRMGVIELAGAHANAHSWMSKQSEQYGAERKQCEHMNERTSEWPSTHILILGLSEVIKACNI